MDKLLNLKLRYTVIIGLILALIGPVLSFFSLISQLGYTYQKAFFYSFTTYTLDLLCVVLFSIFLKYTGVDTSKSLKISFIVNYPVWLFDIFDIYQPLRILSNIGLIISLYWIFSILSKIKNKNYALISIIIYILLYAVNAFISELIATNPVLKTLIKEFIK